MINSCTTVHRKEKTISNYLVSTASFGNKTVTQKRLEQLRNKLLLYHTVTVDIAM